MQQIVKLLHWQPGQEKTPRFIMAQSVVLMALLAPSIKSRLVAVAVLSKLLPVSLISGTLIGIIHSGIITATFPWLRGLGTMRVGHSEPGASPQCNQGELKLSHDGFLFGCMSFPQALLCLSLSLPLSPFPPGYGIILSTA